MTPNGARISFVPIEKYHYPEKTGFRPGTVGFPLKMNFVFVNGGGGDYFNWLRPIQWLCQEATWIEGTLIGPTYLREVAEYFLKPHPKWEFKTYEESKHLSGADSTPTRGPLILQNESLNATGAHLMTCGWVYFTNKECAPAWNDADGVPWDSYPRFRQADLDTVPLPDAASRLEPGKYAVITTGVTTPSRHVPPQYWNHVIEYVRERGLTPVFLGKRVTTTGNLKNIHTTYSDELRLDLGLNLIDQTSLMQAASIISRAAFIVGHDNGLLHLAGMTDAPIVFGYNLASPEHRQPKRPIGRVYNVTLTRNELACIHCQSYCNFVIGYNFQHCMYGDNKCIDMLFEKGAYKWKAAIQNVIELNASADHSKNTGKNVPSSKRRSIE